MLATILAISLFPCCNSTCCTTINTRQSTANQPYSPTCSLMKFRSCPTPTISTTKTKHTSFGALPLAPHDLPPLMTSSSCRQCIMEALINKSIKQGPVVRCFANRKPLSDGPSRPSWASMSAVAPKTTNYTCQAPWTTSVHIPVLHRCFENSLVS